MNRIRTLTRGMVFGLGALWVGLGLCGCVRQIQWLPQVGEVTIEGLDRANSMEAPPALDIQNHRGSVTVIVSPYAKAPRVTALAHQTGAVDANVRWTAASMENDNGRPVLRVLSTPEATGAPDVPVDLRIIVPSCGGVRVQNDGGPVVLQDVSGAIEVRNGLHASDGRSIFIETASALTDPMLLRSESGNVEVRMGRGSAGHITASTQSGRVTVDTGASKTAGVKLTGTSWSGTLNGGASDQRIDVERGDVLVIVGLKDPIRQPDAPWLAPD
jgi:hypothetical protein